MDSFGVFRMRRTAICFKDRELSLGGIGEFFFHMLLRRIFLPYVVTLGIGYCIGWDMFS